MNKVLGIPKEWKERSPLLSQQSYQTWTSIREDPNAPRWNHTVGDRIKKEDLIRAQRFLQEIKKRELQDQGPCVQIMEQLLELKSHCWSIEQRLQRSLCIEDLASQWPRIETIGREELVTDMSQHVPHDIEFDRAVIYDTSGTTGHPLEIFHHPNALAQNHMFVDAIFDLLGIEPNWSAETMGCLNICAQENTYIFCNTFSIWNGSGFAKINLNKADWSSGIAGAQEFCHRWNPILVTSDPISLSTAMRWNIQIRPKLIFSTAVGLTEALQSRLESYFGCPVINCYSATETGPIACSLPFLDGLAVLSPDLYVEIIDESGFPVPDGEIGEICVTGGRNPFLPLLRYRTGDSASIRSVNDSNGNQYRMLSQLQGRGWVSFFRADNSTVNSIDIDRIIRNNGIFVQHQVHQTSKSNLIVQVRPANNLPPNITGLKRALHNLFQDNIDIEVRINEQLGNSAKIQTYICDRIIEE